MIFAFAGSGNCSWTDARNDAFLTLSENLTRG